MDNLKKKSQKLIDISLNHFFVILFVCVVILLYGSISFATEEETDLLLDRFFEYADNYYNIDFSNNTDIHSTNFQNHLSFVHYNKQQLKSKFYAFKNENDSNLENYSNMNAVLMVCWYDSFNLLLLNIPNNTNYNNYAYSQYMGNFNQTVAYYHIISSTRIGLGVDRNGNIRDASFNSNDGSTNLSSYQSWDYGIPMNFSLVMYKDNNYYSSVPNFNGNASYFITNSNASVNGLSDYGFFNINYNESQTIEVDKDIIFGDLYVGYNYSINNQVVYLYNETTSQILDNEIDLLSIGGLYNGCYHYQVVSEDLEGLNEDYQYRLICSSSSSILASFVSKPFRFSFKNEQPGQVLPSIIILSGDYNGVGSGDGFNKAINDINNNIGVLGNKADKINNNIKNIGNYISDTTSPNNVVDEFFSGENVQDLANKFGYVELTNNFYGWVSQMFTSVYNAINVDIPTYQYPGKEGESIELKIRDKTLTFYTEDFNPFHFNVTGLQFNEEQKWYFIRFLIGTFTNGVCAYLLICWFAGFIIKLQSFNLNAVNDLDTDINLF